MLNLDLTPEQITATIAAIDANLVQLASAAGIPEYDAVASALRGARAALAAALAAAAP